MEKTARLINDRFPKWKLILISTFIRGLAAHGSGLFNKYSMADDLLRFDLAATYISGRWMLGEMESLYHLLAGRYIFSTPLFNGLVSILCISLIALFTVDLLGIRSTPGIVASCGVLTVFPTVTGTLGYMFTAPYYFFATLLCTLGVWVYDRYGKWYTFLISAVLIACSVGTYQANIPFCTSLILMALIRRFSESGEPFPQAVKRCLRAFLLCAAFMALYLAVNSIELKLRGISMLSYKGLGTFGTTSVGGYLKRAALAYSEFFRPDTSAELFPMRNKYYHYLTVAVFVVLSALLVIRNIKRNTSSGILTLILIALLPLSFMLIFVMVGQDELHSLMYYGAVLLFVFVIYLAENTELRNMRIKRALPVLASALVILISVIYCKYDNICYLKADCYKSQIASYCTTLTTRIQCIEDYDSSMPVAFVGRGCLDDSNLTAIPQFKEVETIPFSTYGVGKFATSVFKSMAYWNGYSPAIVAEEDYKDLPEVLAMPCYPDAGSIQIVDGTIVVKLSDQYYDLSYWDSIERATGYDVF